MDRDHILRALVIIVLIQSVLLYQNPKVHLLYTRLQDLEAELGKAKFTRDLCTGITLEATDKINEGIFQNSKVILVSYNTTEGATGFLISRAGVYHRKLEVIKFGGPMDILQQFYLHDNKRIANCSKVVDGVYFGGDVKHSNEVNTRILTFSGTMRWRPRELEAEVEAGKWRIGPMARAENVFQEVRIPFAN